MRILAVCLGNICRSPAAAAAIRAAAARAGLEVEVDSAGTGSWHVGEPPHPESVAAAARMGLVVEGRARKINQLDFDRHDMILAMDRSNLSEITALAPSKADQAKIRLFRTFDPDTDQEEVPDPWGGPTSGYEEMIRIVTAAAQGLVDHLVARSGN
ncbi:MAG: low molecular weight phosphotyrosine protein phosphatase [Acidimicrobiia bacterium]|nr:low molecular weight phosphotyrosine protein phosphatase [Acidimicrobiia bacterium]MDH3463725.1 low molecular weight phosphotyrosine protein phosphatase [Acidimicrobiia bacterium]